MMPAAFMAALYCATLVLAALAFATFYCVTGRVPQTLTKSTDQRHFGGGKRTTVRFKDIRAYAEGDDKNFPDYTSFYFLQHGDRNMQEIPTTLKTTIWLTCPLIEIIPLMNLAEMKKVARFHGIKVKANEKKESIQTQLMAHSCLEKPCASFMTRFGCTQEAKSFAVNAAHISQKAEFPPEPMSPQLEHKVLAKLAAAFDPQKFEEAGCLSCGQLTLLTELTDKSSVQVDLTILTGTHATRQERKTDWELSQGLTGPITATGCTGICKKCLKALRKGVVPRLALRNGLWVGDVPVELTGLTFAEKMMISRIRHNKCVVKVTSGRGKLSANAVMFQTPIPKVYDVLPPARDELTEVLAFVYIGTARPTMDTLERTPLLVRRDKVRTALEWLKLNHVGYLDLDISLQNLATYPLRDVPVIPDWHATKEEDIDNVLAMSQHHNEDLEGTTAGDCPFRVHGLTGQEFEKCTTQQLKIKALAHLRGGHPSLGIGHHPKPESIWKNPQAYPSMFPWLFPYGLGGLGNESVLSIPQFGEDQHKQWLLMYHDKRFQTDLYFPLVAFNHSQIKDSKAGASLLADRPRFQNVKSRLQTINPDIVEKLAERALAGETVNAYTVETEEEKKCFALLDDLDLVAGHVDGSITNKKYMNNELWALIAHLGAPSWYITFSPADNKHPLCLYYADQDIHFSPDILPEDERNLRVALNPVAAARFFDYMVKIFLEVILGVGADHDGIYGKTAAYYGTVEQQGRLTLHLHSMVWIENAPSPQEIRDRLLSAKESTDLDARLISYLEACHQGHFFGGNSEDIKTKIAPYRANTRKKGFHDIMDGWDDDDLPMDSLDPNYLDPTLTLPEMPPPFCGEHDPNECQRCEAYEAYRTRFRETVDDILIRSNMHSHTIAKKKGDKSNKSGGAKGCLNEDGVCSARFPRDVVKESYVDIKDGGVVIKHLEAMMNAITPILTFFTRCNTDVSSILSGTAMQAVVLYISNYITKPSLKTHHILQILAKLLRGDSKSEWTNEEEADNPEKVVMKVVNALTAKLEIGSPLACMYLLNFNDHYTSHVFRVFWWKNFVNYVRASWDPELCDQPKVMVNKQDDDYLPYCNVDDYVYRPAVYENVCLYEWGRHYKKMILRKSKRSADGEPPSGWLHFRPGHAQYKTHVVRYIDPMDDLTVLNFVGGILPRWDRGDREFYCCTMLTLFVPWRTGLELKSEDHSWDEEFAAHTFQPWQKKKMANFNIKYECYDARDDYFRIQKKRTKEAQQKNKGCSSDCDDTTDDEQYGLDVEDDCEFPEDSELGRKTLRRLNRMKEAENIMRNAGWVKPLKDIRAVDKPTVEPHERLSPEKWKARVAKARSDVLGKRSLGTSSAESSTGSSNTDKTTKKSPNRVEIVDTLNHLYPTFQKVQKTATDHTNDVIAEKCLNKAQERAFRIVAGHSTSPIENTEPLKMYLGGMGGTGKSQVIKALTLFFERRKEIHRFIILAPTGTAAAALGGSTYHWAFGIRGGDNNVNIPESTSVRRVQSNLEKVDYVFIDEVSMMSCRDMYRVSAKLAKARQEPEKPFGGMNMIFAGDFAQLPPVKAKALYHSVPAITPRMKPGPQQDYIGKAVWHQVTTVVLLTENMRQTEQSAEDKAFRRVLENLRYAECTEDDIEWLKSRVAGLGQGRPKMSDARFRNAAILTPRNAEKDKINELGVKRFAEETGQQLTDFYSIDTMPEQGTTGSRRRKKRRVKQLKQSLKQKLWDLHPFNSKHLAGKLSLCIGMPVMIRNNDATELSITKGQEGIIRGWEASTGPHGKQVLDVVFIELTKPFRDVQIPGLPTNVIPMTRSSRTIECDLPDDSCIEILREQVEILPCFALTIHAAQGLSRDDNPMDLNHDLTHYSYYTALSRGRTAAGTILLQPFNWKKVTDGIDGWLRQELRELEILNELTQLKYEGRLPKGLDIEGRYRSQIIKTYRAWKVQQGGSHKELWKDHHEDNDTGGEWKMTDNDKRQYEGQIKADKRNLEKEHRKRFPQQSLTPCNITQNSIQNLSNTETTPSTSSTLLNTSQNSNTAMCSQATPSTSSTLMNTSQKTNTTMYSQAMNPVTSLSSSYTWLGPNVGRKRDHSTMDPTSDIFSPKKVARTMTDPRAIARPSGLRWDAINHSCAYDSVFTLMWNIWREDPRTHGAFQGCSAVLGDLEREFEQVLHMSTPLEVARNNVRATLHSKAPEEFPYGNDVTAMEALTDRLFEDPIIGQRYIQCSQCGFDQWYGPTPMWSAMALTRIEDRPDTRSDVSNDELRYPIDDWFTEAIQQKFTQACPNCGGTADETTQVRNIVYTPSIMCLNLADHLICPTPIIHLPLPYNKKRRYRLFGVTYHGHAHFTCRYFDKAGRVWFHDGITTGQAAILEDSWPVDIRHGRIEKTKAIQALYIWENDFEQ